MSIDVSIIICTFNRSESLQRTLKALGKVKVPPGCRAELIVVDNASTDGTAKVVEGATLENMETLYAFEPRKGKANGLNTGLTMARGETLVFTDDDVIPSEDWIREIFACFDETQCDALVGKIELAPNLERSWMRKLERYYLAINDFESEPIHWVGANAAFQRRCLQRVRQFDFELGPGALGFGEDTLFGHQLVDAGFKMQYAKRAAVVHQPDKSRLTRRAWLQTARLRARSEAYVLHHWEHGEVRSSALKWLWSLSKLKLRSFLQPPPPLNSEGCPRWEWSHVYDMTFYQQYCMEKRRPRNYVRRGLERLDLSGVLPPFAASQAASKNYRQHSGV
jgi:glycosyltransferase involved in cell wall biosynthesis